MSASAPSREAGPRRERFILLIILSVAAALRLPALDRVPPPLNQDEASRGYDAWCLLETGADRHGQRRPFFLESFGQGDFTAALSAYLTIPFVWMLGPTTVAMRLPDALLSVATVFILHRWLRRRCGSTVALIAAACLAADPWHVSLTRTAHESGFAPFFMAAAVWSLDRSGLIPGITGKNARWNRAYAVCAGAMLALHAWVYPATRMFTPLFCIAAMIVYRKHLAAILRDRLERLTLSAAAIAFVAAAAPLWLTAIAHPNQLAARASTAMLEFDVRYLTRLLAAICENYWAGFHPVYLFWQGNDMSGAPLPDVGMHLLAVAPLMAVGLLLTAARASRDRWSALLLAWFLLAPLPAAICRDWNPHPMRTVSSMILWPTMAGLGGQWLFQWLRRRDMRIGAIVVGLIALSVNTAYFARQYFTQFPKVAELGYQTPLFRAVQYAAKHSKEVQFVLITNYSIQPYIYAMLCEPIEPKSLARDPIVAAQGPLDFHQVLRVGKYYFAPSDPTNYPDAQRLFQDAWLRLPPGATGFVIEQLGAFRDGETVEVFKPTGDLSVGKTYEVRRWQIDKTPSPK